MLKLVRVLGNSHFNQYKKKVKVYSLFSSVRGSQGVNGENTSNTLESFPIPVQDVDEDLEVLCARTEALHVHGYHTIAGKLAMKLAGNILSDESNLNIPLHPGGARNSNRGPDSSTILIKAAFLCNVLAEDLQCHHLAFRVGMLGLEMSRQPARSKALEVMIGMGNRGLIKDWAPGKLKAVRMISFTSLVCPSTEKYFRSKRFATCEKQLFSC